MVKPLIVTTSLPPAGRLTMANTRLALLPLTVRVSLPGPSIAMLAVILNSPLVNGMAPVSPGANRIVVVCPWLALASRMACRNEPGPLSARFRTVITAGVNCAKAQGIVATANAASTYARGAMHFEATTRLHCDFISPPSVAAPPTGHAKNIPEFFGLEYHLFRC